MHCSQSTASAFRRCLIECDVPGIRRLWKRIAPDAPQPASDQEALATLHRARTEAYSIPLKLRFYSHRWLLDHGLASGLPDELKPRAERVYPRIVSAVGIAVKASCPDKIPIAHRVQRAMENAVLEAYESGRTDPEFVRGQIIAARQSIIRSL